MALKLNNIFLTVAGTDYPVYDNATKTSACPRINYFTMGTGASNYGTGAVLMSKDDYTNATKNPGYGAATLIMKSNQGPGLTLDVYIIGAALYSTAVDDSKDIFLVQLADQRIFYTKRISSSYNVQNQGFFYSSTDNLMYYGSTLNAGSQYTWVQVFSAIESAITVPGTISWKPQNLIFDSLPICKTIDKMAAQLFFVVGFDYTDVQLYQPGSHSTENATLLNTALGLSGNDPPPSQIGGGSSMRNPGRLPSSYDVIFPAVNMDGNDPYSTRQYIKSVPAGPAGANPDFSLPLPSPGYLATYLGGVWQNQSTLDSVATDIGARAIAFQDVPFITYEFAGIWNFTPDGGWRRITWYQDSLNRMRTRIEQDNAVDYDPARKPDAMEFPANQLVTGLGSTQSGCTNDGERVIFGKQSDDVIVKILSDISGAGGKYNGSIYGGVMIDDGTGNFSMPDGLTAGQDCLVVNLDEQGFPSETHWAIADGSAYAEGVLAGMSTESPPRPIVRIQRAVYRTSNPQALLAGSAADESAATDNWIRSVSTTGNQYGDTAVSMQCVSRVIWNPTSPTPTLEYAYRIKTWAADGRLDSISDETVVTVDVPESCAS